MLSSGTQVIIPFAATADGIASAEVVSAGFGSSDAMGVIGATFGLTYYAYSFRHTS